MGVGDQFACASLVAAFSLALLITANLFVESGGFCEVALTRGRGKRLSRDLIEAGLNEGAEGWVRW